MTDKPANRLKLRRQISEAITNLQPPRVADVIASPRASAKPLRGRLMSLDNHGRPGPPRSVEINDVDGHRITFHHSSPLRTRRAMIVLEGQGTERFTVEVDLSWCRFNCKGRYTSGGRFVQLVGRIA